MACASVVIPTYGDANTLGAAILSALNQTIDVEVIVVDDASPDNTREVIDSIDSQDVTLYEHDSNRGGSAARNTGIEVASTRYIGFLDADDEWRSTKLERQIELLESRSDCWVGCYCGWEHKRSGAVTQLLNDVVPRPAGLEGGEPLIEPLMRRQFSMAGGSTLLVTDEAVDEIGGWDVRFPRLQDIEFAIRLLKHGKIGYVDAPLVVLNSTSRPAIEDVKKAYSLFREVFQEDIESVGSGVTSPVREQDFLLAKQYFFAGHMTDGIQALSGSRCPHMRDALGLGLAIAIGMKKQIQNL